MDYFIVEEFNRFWYLFSVVAGPLPQRRACTLRLWMQMPQDKRSAIIAELERNGPPEGRNPYFYVQDFGVTRTRTLSFNDYYKKYGTTEERDGWHMANPTGQQVIYIQSQS